MGWTRVAARARYKGRIAYVDYYEGSGVFALRDHTDQPFTAHRDELEFLKGPTKFVWDGVHDED